MVTNIIQIFNKAIVLTLIVLNVRGLSANGYELKVDTDYYGGDLYPIYNINSSLVCMNYCESIRGCRLATWCEDICYIKDTKTEPSEKLGCITFDMYPDENSDSYMSFSGSGEMDIQVEEPTVVPQVDIPAPTTTLPDTIMPASTDASSSSSRSLTIMNMAQSICMISLYYVMS
jgi:hypothetical protein